MTEEQRRQLTIHEQYPNIPLGVDLRAITRADRSPARGILDETITVERLLRQDRLKGGPMELFRIELAVADWAHECAARGDRTVAELLVPEPGWTLPTQTRRSFQKLARFELRTVVYSVDSDRREDYYDTDRGRNPALPVRSQTTSAWEQVSRLKCRSAPAATTLSSRATPKARCTSTGSATTSQSEDILAARYGSRSPAAASSFGIR